MTEQQKYRVLQSHGDFELREYAECVVADVVVTGDADRASSEAFRPLFSYISGANRSADSLSMTAPVIQEPAGDQRWTVSFVLPSDHPGDEYPTPNDPKVSLWKVPQELAAALRWSGRWTSSNVAKRTQELEQAIEQKGWQVAGDPRWARFDPPWKPAFVRRNEIVIPVQMP